MPTDNTLGEPVSLLREAHRRLLENAPFRYRAELTARVVQELRTANPKTRPRCDMDDDRVIAALALVVATLDLPGGPSARDRLADLLAHHAFSHISEEGYTVCLCGHVAEGDDDDGSHARHQADVAVRLWKESSELG